MLPTAPYISVVSPVYRAEKMVDELVSRIIENVSLITDNFEIVLVEDGSPDKSWEAIETYCAKDKRVVGIKLSRNFGQHHAITAGLKNAKGSWIVVMDCDLQDRPQEIPKLYAEAKKGFDIVFAQRANRKDTFWKRQTSAAFYKVFSYLSGIKQDGTISNFGIYSRKVVDAINLLNEPMRAFSPMARWVGFKKTSIAVEHGHRYEGTTSYNWSRLISLALDISLSYSDKPLRLTVQLGLIISLLAAVYASVIITLYAMGKVDTAGYASLIVSIWFLSGLIIFTLGIIGLYIGKAFEGIKNRPIYIIEEKLN